MKMPEAPTIEMSNGYKIPVVGLGTWQSNSATQAVRDAIDAGYRHIDCALFYSNEEDVGVAIKEKIASGVVKREELFITSKLWCTFLRPDLVEQSLRLSLKNLGLDYLDLYLIHWPCALREGCSFLPKKHEHEMLAEFGDVDYVDTWKAMEEVAKKGLTKSIGISNFNTRQIKRVLEIAEITPVNIQIEIHPYFPNKKLVEFCKSNGMTVTAYSPLGSPGRPWKTPRDPILAEDPIIKEVATKHKKSGAQVILRYLIQSGLIVIPKSGNQKRINEDINIFDFELTSDDMALIASLDHNERVVWLLELIGHPHYPFNGEY